MTAPLLLIGGIPGTGKTTFAEWLAARGWTAIDHDEVMANGVVRSDMDKAWSAVFAQQPPAVYPFVKFARQWSTPVVVEYGLPARWWRLVIQLRAAGMQPWWFDGDRDAAYQSWRNRNASRTPAYPDYIWKRTVDDIKTDWPGISRAFGSNVIRAVEAGPWHMPEADIYRAIFGADPD